jgi:hypothetical protein
LHLLPHRFFKLHMQFAGVGRPATSSAAYLRRFLHRPRVTGFQWQGMELNICEGLVGDKIPHKIGKITVFKAFSFG